MLQFCWISELLLATELHPSQLCNFLRKYNGMVKEIWVTLKNIREQQIIVVAKKAI